MAKKDIDYSELIAEIEAKGSSNWTDADKQNLYNYETARNAKIDSLNKAGTNTFYNPDGSSYAAQKTNKYSQYGSQPTNSVVDTYNGNYRNTDLSGILENAMKNGSTDYSYLNAMNNERANKAMTALDKNGNPLTQYAYDELYGRVKDYINAGTKYQGYDPAPQYNDPYAELRNSLMQKVLGMNYEDWMKGSSYQQLAESYRRNGQNAMQDTLGQIAARTGGIASSYATSAASQAYNNYMSQLQSAAMDRYNNDRSQLLSNANLVNDMSNMDYQRFLNDRTQYNNDREFDYRTWADDLSNNRYDSEYAFDLKKYEDSKAQQALENDRYDQKYADTMAQQALENQRYDQQYADSRADTDRAYALDKAKTLASFGDFSGFKALGYSDDEVNNMATQYKLEQAASKKKSSSDTSRKYSDETEFELTPSIQSLFERARGSKDPYKFLKDNYKGYGADLNGLYGYYDEWNKAYDEDGDSPENQTIDDVTFDNAMTRLYEYLRNGRLDDADNLSDDYWNRLTRNQRDELQRIYATFNRRF